LTAIAMLTAEHDYVGVYTADGLATPPATPKHRNCRSETPPNPNPDSVPVFYFSSYTANTVLGCCKGILIPV